MNILALRYAFATDMGLAISIISLIFAMVTLLVITENSKLLVRVSICGVSAILVGLLFINQKDMKNYIEVPYVEGKPIEFAKNDLINAGFENKDILISNVNATSSNSAAEVQDQDIVAGSIVPKGTQIKIECEPTTYIENYKENIVISGAESSPSDNGLSIMIDDYESFTDGFYYKMPIDENSYSFVDFDKGVSGHFSYSRELTEQEYENWGHGGKILDAYGKEVNINASFFSTFDGVFAVELPEYMPKGDYVYLLYQFIDNAYCEARIYFTVD